MKLCFGIILFFIVMSSCQEKYNDISSYNSDVYIVEGMLTNKEKPVSVSLFKAQPMFGDSSYSKMPVTNAYVKIISASGFELTLYANNHSGIYMSDSIFSGIIGEKYKISITLDDGAIIESSFAELHKTANIDTLVSVKDYKIDLLKDDKGNFYEDTTYGLKLGLRFHPIINEEANYYIESTIIEQTYHSYFPYGRGGNLSSIIVFCTNRYEASNRLIIKSAAQVSKLDKVTVDAGFLNEFKVNYVEDFHIDPNISGGMVCINKVFTIDNSTFSVFDNINKQTEPDNSIFDPVPTQVASNLHCSSKNIKIVGYFAVAGVSEYFTVFEWKHKDLPYKQRKLNSYFDDCKLDCYNYTKPFFWVDF